MVEREIKRRNRNPKPIKKENIVSLPKYCELPSRIKMDYVIQVLRKDKNSKLWNKMITKWNYNDLLKFEKLERL